MTTSRRSLLLLALVGLLVLTALTYAFRAYTQDDVFITYVYSRNIARGVGFVFNPGQQVQGTTTPLYTLLMAAVYSLTTDLLHAGNLLSAAFLSLAAMLAYRLTTPQLSRAGRAALVLMLLVSPLVYVSFGMETLFYCALLLQAFWHWRNDRPELALLTAAILTWTRADGIVLAGTFGLLALWQYRRIPVKLIGIYVLGIAPWFLFAWAYFGSPLPNTFGAKQEFLQGIKFWTDGFNWWSSFYGNNPLSLLAIPLIGLGFWRAMRLRELRAVALWALFYALGYTALNVTAFWYYTPFFMALVILTAIGGDWLARTMIAPRFGKMRTLIVAAALAGVSIVLAFARALDFASPPERVATYEIVGGWIKQNTPSQSVIGVRDLGLLGYFSERPALDSYGLIVPDMHIHEDEYTTVKYKPDYVTTTQYWSYARFVKADWFLYHYAPVAQFSTPRDAFSPMGVYVRRLALTTPSEAVQGSILPLTCRVNVSAGQALPSETRAVLLNAAGNVIAQSAHPFLWNQYPAAQALTGESFVEQIGLPLDVPPGEYRWRLMCDQTTEGIVTVSSLEKSAGYTPVMDAPSWAPFARLTAVALPEGAEAWSGGSVAMTLVWQAMGAAPQDYSLFVHLVDSQGAMVAQTDGYAVEGTRPTTSWKTGEILIDRRRIMLPPALPVGDYRLVIGWYDWRTNQRLPSITGAEQITLPTQSIHIRWPGGSGLP